MACYGGPHDGGRYDLSKACPVCGTGSIRLDPLRLPAAKFKTRVAITYDHEVVIPPELIPKLKKIVPECLKKIHHGTVKAAEPSGYCQLITQITLPCWSKQTTGFEKEDECPHCKRDGFFNIPRVPLRIVYDEQVPAFNVAETYECFGNSKLREPFKESHFASPLLIVNEAVQQILAGEKGVEFEPVTFPT